MPLLRLLVASVLLTGTVASSQTVLKRARLANSTEGLTYVSKGRWSDHWVVTDAFNLVALRAKPNGQQGPQKIADLRALPLNEAPRGVAFLESERAFALHDYNQVDRFFLVDEKGAFTATRTISHLNGFVPFVLEGFASVPTGAPRFPGHLVVIALDEYIVARLEVIRPDGQVVHEVTLPPEIAEGQPFGLAVVGDRIEITVDGDLYAVDFDGNLLSGPVSTGLSGVEGIAHDQDGDLGMVDHGSGKVFVVDAAFAPLPAKTRHFEVGVGFRGISKLAWSAARGEFLISEHPAIYGGKAPVWGVPPTLDARAPFLDESSGIRSISGLCTFASDQSIAIASTAKPRSVYSFDPTGAALGAVEFATQYPRYVACADQTSELVMDGRGFGTIYLAAYSRTGMQTRFVQLVGEGLGQYITGLTMFPSSTGERVLVLTDNGRVTNASLDGSTAGSYDLRSLTGGWSQSLTAITSGPYAGAFATIVPDTMEVVIFSLPLH